MQGMLDAQLVRLADMLKSSNIWALNVGENFEISMDAWYQFVEDLKHTRVSFLYVSEHHLVHAPGLKEELMAAIRSNRRYTMLYS